MIGPIARALLRRQAAVALLVLEVGFGFAVSVQAFGLGQWFVRKTGTPSGIDPGVLVVRSDLAGGEPGSPAFIDDLRRRDLAALRALPGVVAATGANHTPMTRTIHPQAVEGRGDAGSTWSFGWVLDGQPATCATLGLAITAGRDLTESDAGGDVVLLSPALAEALFDGSPVGRTLRMRGRARVFTVVGVTSALHAPSPFAVQSDRVVFVPDKLPATGEQRYLVRAAADRLDEVRAAAPGALAQVFPDRAVRVASVADMRAHNDRSGRGGTAIFYFMVVLALLVTLLGSLAMSSFLVAERTKQIGMRRALGATKTDVVRYFLIENWLVTTLGLLIGLPLTFLLFVLARRQQADLTLEWPAILFGMVVFWVVGLLAALVPALRATAVPPSVASKTV
jgi:putative ABC transport system permease protein